MTYSSDQDNTSDEDVELDPRFSSDEVLRPEPGPCREDEDKIDPGEIVSMVVDAIVSTIFFW